MKRTKHHWHLACAIVRTWTHKLVLVVVETAGGLTKGKQQVLLRLACRSCWRRRGRGAALCQQGLDLHPLWMQGGTCANAALARPLLSLKAHKAHKPRRRSLGPMDQQTWHALISTW